MMMFGGPVVWILIVLAAVAVFTFFERLVDLRRAQIDYEDFLKGVTNVLSGGSADEALAICEDTVAPVSSVVATAIRHRRDSARLLREAVDSQGRAEVGRLDRRLAVIAIIAQVAPALGLLGTVVGFIRVVRAANATEIVSRVALMDGTMDALMSAAFGLAVAILASTTYGFLRVRLDRIVVELEAAASQIVGFISTQREREAAKEKEAAR
jgi:biopolymer transport protein ExbB